jgi:3-deoxy-D-manno-octulosonic-acid transferase
LLYSLYKKKPNKPSVGRRWKEHFGFTPKLNTDEQPIWIHAVSVGECIAATPLIKKLKAQNPDKTIVVTTTTSTGAQQIEKLGDWVTHRYMPVDFRFAIRGFIKAIKPQQLLIIETELWPNMLSVVKGSNIPITLINARLSAKSRDSYHKFRLLFNTMHPNIERILCQSNQDCDNFKYLGVDASKLAVTGSIKFDISVPQSAIDSGKQLRSQLGTQRPVWIAASTHNGEDQKALDAHKMVLKQHPNALLILVPRHPERFDDVYALCIQNQLQTIRRSGADVETPHTQVYLADSMGEMLAMLSAADICFMGGSLGSAKVGGHNVLEPAILAMPIIIGPHYYNFKDIVERLRQHKGLYDVHNANELGETVCKLIANPSLAREAGKHSFSFAQSQQGALAKTIDAISNRDTQ